MPPPPTRQIIVTDLKTIRAGHTSSGEPYTLSQVRATGMDGIPIEQNLRTFDELPLDVPVTVTVDYFRSQRGYGDSYTVKLVSDGVNASTAAPSPPPAITAPQVQAPESPPPPAPTPGNDRLVRDLLARVAKLEEQVSALRIETERLRQGQTEVPKQPDAQHTQQPVW